MQFAKPTKRNYARFVVQLLQGTDGLVVVQVPCSAIRDAVHEGREWDGRALSHNDLACTQFDSSIGNQLSIPLGA